MKEGIPQERPTGPGKDATHMTAPENHIPRPGREALGLEDPEQRARRIEELKRRVQAGTYLIQRYEIIEGILDALSRDPD